MFMCYIHSLLFLIVTPVNNWTAVHTVAANSFIYSPQIWIWCSNMAW